jgi:hypothetical protein
LWPIVFSAVVIVLEWAGSGGRYRVSQRFHRRPRGFLGPTVVGKLKEQTRDYAAAMATALVVAFVIVLILGRAMAAGPFVVKPTV